MQCKDVKEVLITKEQLEQRVTELGAMITKDYKGKDPLIVGVLKGSWIFFADLIRKIELGCTVDFIDISTYGSSTRSSGEVRFNKDFDNSVDGKDIIMVEDIIDTGVTMNFIVNLLKTRGANSVRIASLLSKPSRRKIDITIDYLGFDIPDEFVIGYGLDYAEKYRGLDFIGILHENCYK
ncbi:MAG: hypoxanthine phosphoribosyltransferase [Clostridia bacterium]